MFAAIGEGVSVFSAEGAIQRTDINIHLEKVLSRAFSAGGFWDFTS
jgi:hypothetical protein